MLPWCQQLQETDTGTQRDISAAIILRCKLTEYLRTTHCNQPLQITAGGHGGIKIKAI